MMKKITRIATLLAATAFLLAGFPACSDDEGDDDPTLEKIEINADGAKTEYNVGDPFDNAGITITAKYSDGSTKDVTADATLTATSEDGEPFTTATADTFEVTLTATYEGETSEPVTCTITVKNGSSDGDTEQGGGDGNGDGDNPENPPEEIPEGLTVAQKVTDEAVTETGWYQTTANTSGNIVQQTANGAISVNIKDSSCPTPEYILKDAISGAVKITATFNITQAGNSCGIMEILDADGNALFQPARINGYNASSGITITTRSGSENTQKSPTIALGTDFTVETIINFDAGKFQTKVDATSLPVQTFSGEDKALKAIKFNPKTSGTVMTISGVTVTEVAQEAIPDDLKPTVFDPKTASVTNEDLGLIAAEVSGSDTVATGAKTDTGVTFTAVAPGTATATVKDASGNTATVTVTVAEDGAVTAKVKDAYVSGQSKISYFTESTDSVTATVTGDLISGSDVDFGFDVEGFSKGSVSANTAKVDSKDFPGIIVTCASTIVGSTEDKKSLSVESSKTVGWAKFTVTAQKACKITKIMATTGQTQSGNLGTAIYVGDASTPVNTPAGAKVSSVEIELKEPIALEANATKEIKVAIYAAKKWEKKDQIGTIKCDMYFMNFAVTAEATQ